jgi:hypothetical protein
VPTRYVDALARLVFRKPFEDLDVKERAELNSYRGAERPEAE